MSLTVTDASFDGKDGSYILYNDTMLDEFEQMGSPISEGVNRKQSNPSERILTF